MVRTVERKEKTAGSVDLEYTPSLEELKDYADRLAGKKSTRSKEIGRNMVGALEGRAIVEDGGAHDAYRDICYVIAKKWPHCNAAEIVGHLEESVAERFSHKADASTDIANVVDAMYTALDKAQEQAESWQGQLIMSDQGTPLGTLGNTLLFFENHPAWEGKLGFNDRTRSYTFLEPPPIGGKARDVDEDHDGAKLCVWFQAKAQMVLESKKAMEALHAAASIASFDPLQQELLSLIGTWDGVPRLEQVLQRVGGAEDTPWVRMIFPLWMRSLVARILWPGCKVDTMLILEGLQGYKKSTFFQSLLPHKKYFDSSLVRLKHDLYTHRHIHSGPAIIEMSELVGLNQHEVEDIKAFLSTTEDTFDEKYRKARMVPRRCVFVGSTNKETYLRDDSGGRRFWPVKVYKRIDAAIVLAERHQWFAEALHHILELKETWWIESDSDEALATAEQDARYEEDIWQETIFAWLDAGRLSPPANASEALAGSSPYGDTTRHLPNAVTTQQMTENANKTRAGEYVTISQVAEYALFIEMKNARGAEGIRIEKILRRYGCIPSRISVNKKQVRAWKVPRKDT
jgi:predicted P-loop ATPase